MSGLPIIRSNSESIIWTSFKSMISLVLFNSLAISTDRLVTPKLFVVLTLLSAPLISDTLFLTLTQYIDPGEVGFRLPPQWGLPVKIPVPYPYRDHR